MWLRGKTIVLTGASGGLGTALARKLAPNNTLLLIGRKTDSLHQLLSTLPGKHRMITGDLGSSAGCRKVISNLIAQDQAIDVLINNAGQSLFSSFESECPERIESIMNLNLIAPMLLTRGLEPLFRAEGCRVVNVGSTFGSIGFPGFSIYGASKFGLRGFSEALSREWAQSLHSVHYVAPRAIHTKANSRSVIKLNAALGNKMDSPESVAQQIIRSIELNRVCSHFGWPEKFLAPLNMLLPALVSRSLAKQLDSINYFMKESSHANT